MSFSDEVCEYGYSQSYEHFGQQSCGASSPSASVSSSASGGANQCKKGELYYCGQKAGLDKWCGCLSNQGGAADWYIKTNDIACGADNSYVCSYVKEGNNEPRVRCGCLFDYKMDSAENILTNIK